MRGIIFKTFYKLVGGLEHFLYFYIIIGNNHQLTNIFQRGSTTNQYIYTCLSNVYPYASILVVPRLPGIPGAGEPLEEPRPAALGALQWHG
jgi:hypothetical protein